MGKYNHVLEPPWKFISVMVTEPTRYSSLTTKKATVWTMVTFPLPWPGNSILDVLTPPWRLQGWMLSECLSHCPLLQNWPVNSNPRHQGSISNSTYLISCSRSQPICTGVITSFSGLQALLCGFEKVASLLPIFNTEDFQSHYSTSEPPNVMNLVLCIFEQSVKISEEAWAEQLTKFVGEHNTTLIKWGVRCVHCVTMSAVLPGDAGQVRCTCTCWLCEALGSGAWSSPGTLGGMGRYQKAVSDECVHCFLLWWFILLTCMHSWYCCESRGQGVKTATCTGFASGPPEAAKGPSLHAQCHRFASSWVSVDHWYFVQGSLTPVPRLIESMSWSVLLNDLTRRSRDAGD